MGVNLGRGLVTYEQGAHPACRLLGDCFLFFYRMFSLFKKKISIDFPWHKCSLLSIKFANASVKQRLKGVPPTPRKAAVGRARNVSEIC